MALNGVNLQYMYVQTRAYRPKGCDSIANKEETFYLVFYLFYEAASSENRLHNHFDSSHC